MTETTDTKALRVEIAELRLEIAKGYGRFIPETKIHIKLLERILDQLEAERQQREAAEKERGELKSAHGNMVVRCALLRQRPDLPVDRIPAYEALVKAQEELAALRGTQEPMALVTDKFIAYLPKQGGGERWPVGTKLYAHPVMPVINLNHIGRITAQISGQRYTYFSAEDVRHYFEEMKCEIVERAASSGDTVYIPHQELPKPVVALPQRYSPCAMAGKGIAVKDSSGDYLSYQQVVIALSSAGIVVKDGELYG